MFCSFNDESRSKPPLSRCAGSTASITSQRAVEPEERELVSACNEPKRQLYRTLPGQNRVVP